MPNRKEYRLILDSEDTWKKYQALCALEGTTAAAKLREHIAKEAARLDKMMKK